MFVFWCEFVLHVLLGMTILTVSAAWADKAGRFARYLYRRVAMHQLEGVGSGSAGGGDDGSGFMKGEQRIEIDVASWSSLAATGWFHRRALDVSEDPDYEKRELEVVEPGSSFSSTV